MASIFADFKKTGFKFTVVHLVDESKGFQCLKNGLKYVLF